jgi:hypothetical protein
MCILFSFLQHRKLVVASVLGKNDQERDLQGAAAESRGGMQMADRRTAIQVHAVPQRCRSFQDHGHVQRSVQGVPEVACGVDAFFIETLLAILASAIVSLIRHICPQGYSALRGTSSPCRPQHYAPLPPTSNIIAEGLAGQDGTCVHPGR